MLSGRGKFDVSGRGTEMCSTEDWLMIWESTTSVGLFEELDSTVVVTVLLALLNGLLLVMVEAEVRAIWSSEVNLKSSRSLVISMPIRQYIARTIAITIL